MNRIHAELAMQQNENRGERRSSPGRRGQRLARVVVLCQTTRTFPPWRRRTQQGQGGREAQRANNKTQCGRRTTEVWAAAGLSAR